MPLNFVIARFAEDVDWLTEVPSDINIYLYNKGGAGLSAELLNQLTSLEGRRNVGREAETYLHYLLSKGAALEDGFTIFCQGDPFSHGPDLLKLLKHRQEWADIQPLTVQWLSERDIPPVTLVEAETEEHIDDLRIRSELFSLHTWNPVRFVDDGAIRIGRDYLSGHGLPAGTNIAAHFLRSAGWNELAVEAEAAEFGQFAYGAIFAVRNELLRRIPEDVLRRLHLMSRSHPLYPWIFERLWLHLFGLPFHPAIQRHSGNVGSLRGAVESSSPVEALCR